MAPETVTLINQNHDVKGEVIEFKDELMRVRLAEGHGIDLSEFILVLYKGKQIESKVIVVKPDETGLFIPRLPDDYFEDRRNFPRTPVDYPAVLILKNGEVVNITLLDISHRGFSFTVDEKKEMADGEQTVTVIVQSEQLPVICEAVLCHQEEQAGRTRYGATIRFMHNKSIRVLYEFMFSKLM
jgi:hypothetical protein